MEQNPRIWAEQNLSPARARSFIRAMRELENKKFSQEWREENRKLDVIAGKWATENTERVGAVRLKYAGVISELESQIRNLQGRLTEILHQQSEEELTIRTEVYRSEEYDAQQKRASEIWHRDDAIFRPKLEELMRKYEEAQKAVSA